MTVGIADCLIYHRVGCPALLIYQDDIAAEYPCRPKRNCRDTIRKTFCVFL
jgi:hypothetical protein